MNRLKIGDKVVIKGGTETLIIEAIKEDKAYCLWWGDEYGRYTTDYFNIDDLVLNKGTA